MGWISVALFVLIGTFFWISLMRKVLEWRRFGPVPLHIDNDPRVGGKLQGLLIFSKGMQGGLGIKLEFYCNNVYRKEFVDKDGNKKSHVFERTIAMTEGECFTEQGPKDQVYAKVELDVPEKGKPTNIVPEKKIKKGHTYHQWALTAKATLAGSDLSRKYLVVVS